MINNILILAQAKTIQWIIAGSVLLSLTSCGLKKSPRAFDLDFRPELPERTAVGVSSKKTNQPKTETKK